METPLRRGALLTAGALALTLVAPTAAHAGREGRRNTAIALGAVAAYGILKKKPEIAGLAGAGAIYSFVRSQQSERRRPRRAARLRRARIYERPVYVREVHRHYDGCGHPGYGGPPGWSRGRKTGWGGGHLPPGLAKKYR